jgi:hypothetical protein
LLTGQRPDGKLIARLREEGRRRTLEHVRLALAPNRPEPLEVYDDMIGRGQRESAGFFYHVTLAERYHPGATKAALARGGRFPVKAEARPMIPA